MLLSSFLAEFKHRAGVFVTPSVVLLHRPLEVYDLARDKVIAKGNKKNRFDDSILDTVIDGRTLLQHITSWKVLPEVLIYGGNGSGSDSYNESWDFSGNDRSGNDDEDYPARFNQRTKSPEDTLRRFNERHAGDNMQEHGILVDDRGFVTKYVHGNGGSVNIAARNGEMIYHNHPASGWPNFSKNDIYAATVENSRGIVASSSRAGRNEQTINYAGTYSFTKNQNFDANGFLKELNRAQLKGKDYNDAVGKWLGNKARQRKYGYKYSFTPAK